MEGAKTLAVSLRRIAVVAAVLVLAALSPEGVQGVLGGMEWGAPVYLGKTRMPAPALTNTLLTRSLAAAASTMVLIAQCDELGVAGAIGNAFRFIVDHSPSPQRRLVAVTVALWVPALASLLVDGMALVVLGIRVILYLESHGLVAPVSDAARNRQYR